MIFLQPWTQVMGNSLPMVLAMIIQTDPVALSMSHKNSVMENFSKFIRHHGKCFPVNVFLEKIFRESVFITPKKIYLCPD